jgi:hypothetical protein
MTGHKAVATSLRPRTGFHVDATTDSPQSRSADGLKSCPRLRTTLYLDE